MRYFKQKDGYSCGPVAVLNALKWDGQHITSEDLPELRWMAFCTSPHGCWPEHLDKLIRAKFKRRVSKKMGRPSLRYMDWWLNRGNSIVLRYFWHNKEKNERIGHYIFIPGRTKTHYYVVNDGKKLPTLAKMPRSTMNKYLRMKRGAESCCTWFIERLK